MEKEFLKQCIAKEVYGDYSACKLSLIDKFWRRYFRPRSNAVFLIRKFQYHIGKTKSGGFRLWHTILSRMYSVKLVRRYSISVHPDAEIGIGMRIIHPAGLYITNATIGNNTTFFQNCTIGVKQIDDDKKGKAARIGNNLVMYANSMIIGNINVADDVTIGACSCLTYDVDEGGVYIGIPAKKK